MNTFEDIYYEELMWCRLVIGLYDADYSLYYRSFLS